MWNRICALGRAFLNLIYPLSCVACGAKMTENRGLCAACVARIRRNPYGIAACEYEGVLKQAIRLFKYNGFTALGRTFADLVMEFTDRNIDIKKIDAIVPVPLYPARERERGFNQAYLISLPIAKRYGVSLRPGFLARIRHTGPQSFLTRSRRLVNVRGVFSVPDPRAVRGKNLLVVDDVCATGATINQAAKALLGAGASRVLAVTLARGV